MHVQFVRNASEALERGLRHVMLNGQSMDSRVGDVIVAPSPVTTVYEQPRERVILEASRDANPFFHLFESLWMLAGRRDAVWLDRYVSDFSERFAEDDGLQHGAYGYRWREHFEIDQIEICVDELIRNQDSRQAVIQMWDPQTDLQAGVRDVPCNTTIYLRLRPSRRGVRALDLTVCCRSNDVIWGAHGANAVHFSILQEFIAASVGADVGYLYQVSNNYHAYKSVLEKFAGFVDEHCYANLFALPTTLVSSSSMVSSLKQDIADFMRGGGERGKWATPFFSETVSPMWTAHRLYSTGRRQEAIKILTGDRDWIVAGRQWIERRL